MGFAEDLRRQLARITDSSGRSGMAMERFVAEVEFAGRLAAAQPEREAEWKSLILSAAAAVEKRLNAAGPADVEAVVREAEQMMAPMAKAAKEYTIHCVAHAHIDMNWLWPWPETVSVCYDTFATMDRLLDEFPEFHFSQSQVSVYKAMQDYCPEVFERIRKRIAEGRWEVTASQWVEGDKNMASGEIICRHLLYTKRWLRDNLGLPFDSVKIDWECDTFGHAHTLPGILRRGGVTRYYFHRCGAGHRLFWWQSKDGSRVLAFDDGRSGGYNGDIAPRMAHFLFEYEQQTGLKDIMWVYGVGDHGGGPTRQYLRTAREMNSWPVFPNVKLTTTDGFFSAVEGRAKDLPVVDSELQYQFRGCYTSQSRMKQANRMNENALVEAEAVALIAARTVGFPYPADSLTTAWHLAMFNQFHDILPGSGGHETYEYALAQSQEVLCRTGSIRTRALRSIAARVATTSLAGAVGAAPANSGPSLGAGVGEGAWWGGISTLGFGAVEVEPFIIFNPSPWQRTEIVEAKVWNCDLPREQIIVHDGAGGVVPGQVVGQGNYWGHRFVTVAFPAKDVPGLGWRCYGIARSAEVPAAAGASADGSGRLENEFFRIQVEPCSGAIISLVDKRTGYDFVPRGKRLGVLQFITEAHNGMTAWEITQILRVEDQVGGAEMRVGQTGPHRATIVSSSKRNESTLTLTISLAAGVPRVDFQLNVNWLERGHQQVGVPTLRVAFPVAVADGEATFEVPFGSVTRPLDGLDVPALRWAALNGKGIGEEAQDQVGVCLVNDSKYGYSAADGEIRLTLLRSSYDPDPLPELGSHTIRYALVPHVGPWQESLAVRAAAEFNHPFSVVGTDLHDGELPATKGFAALETANVMLSGLKKAEDSDALIVRLYEIEGRKTEARLRLDPALAKPGSQSVETDLLEQPLAQNTARMDGDTLVVTVPPFGIATVKVG
jgi:alpha-mannosidase